jgi:hypothetical protein
MQYYKIVVGGQSKVVESSKALPTVEAMVKDAGRPFDSTCDGVYRCDADGNLETVTVTAIIPVVPNAAANNLSADIGTDLKVTVPVYSDFGSGNQVMDTEARARLDATYDNLEANGIKGIARETTAMGYKPGTRMAEIGYNSQAQRKLDHEGKMPVTQAIEELNSVINAEQRREIEVTTKELINSISDTGSLTALKFRLTEHAIKGLFTRLNANDQGSKDYPLKASGLSRILELRERIAAATALDEKNRQNRLAPAIARYDEVAKMIAADRAELSHCLRHELSRFPDVRLKLRVRENPALNDIFAILSPSYTVADAPLITPEFLKAGVPDDARGNWSYDPYTTGWSIDIATWTPTDTLSQVIGEPVSGMVSFSGKDNGTGRLNGDGGILIIQCLNASLYSAGEVEVSRVHRGAVLFDAAKMLRAALASINTLSEAWGNNRKIVVEPPSTLTLEQAMPGFWRSLLNKGELVSVLPGRKENHVVGLTRAYFDQRRDDEQLIRSDFAQGWTKYIQNQPTEVRREAEQAIGAWLAKPSKMDCDLKVKE